MNISQFIAPAFAALLGIGTAFADVWHQETLLVEVFTTTGLEVQWESVSGTNEALKNIDVQSYELDGIQRFEAQLSSNLPADPDQSKRVVLQRFQQLREEDRTWMQRAAMGLAKAMQYGIDRYPAIVFEGKTVVYGVTYIGDAVQRYRQWQEGQKQ